MSEALFSSASNEWETPQDFFDRLDKEFRFRLDPCATPENAKCEKFFTRADDGLKQSWLIDVGSVFVNPPYGRDIDKWLKKACETALAGRAVVVLVPARTDTTWWHDWAMRASEIRLIRGRLKFGGSTNAPFPSALLIYRAWGGGIGRCRNFTTMNAKESTNDLSN